MPASASLRNLAKFATLIAMAVVMVLWGVGCGTPAPQGDDEEDLADLFFDHGSRQVVAIPYAAVVAAARERFIRTYPGGHFALLAELGEDPEKNRLDITFHEFIDYAHVMETDLRIISLDDGRTRIEATVTKFYRSWYFRSRQEALEKALLEVFAERLRTGSWPPFPWKPSGSKTPAARPSPTPAP